MKTTKKMLLVGGMLAFSQGANAAYEIKLTDEDTITLGGFIKVDEFYRTNVDGINAIGDVIGGALLAHVASHEGVIAAESIAGGHPHTMNQDNIPGCTYCHPQVGSVGLTEEVAKERGLEYKVGRYNYSANGKAQATGDSDLGLVKTIFD